MLAPKCFVLAVVIVHTTGSKGTIAFYMHQLYNLFYSFIVKVSSILSNTGRPILITPLGDSIVIPDHFSLAWLRGNKGSPKRPYCTLNFRIYSRLDLRPQKNLAESVSVIYFSPVLWPVFMATLYVEIVAANEHIHRHTILTQIHFLYRCINASLFDSPSKIDHLRIVAKERS